MQAVTFPLSWRHIVEHRSSQYQTHNTDSQLCTGPPARSTHTIVQRIPLTMPNRGTHTTRSCTDYHKQTGPILYLP